MFEGKYVNFRSLEVEDLKLLRKWRNDKKTRIHTREFRLLNMINQKHWFESIHTENPPKFIMFGVSNKKNQLIGMCGLTYIDWKNKHAEISIILSQKNWQRTKEAQNTIEMLIQYGFSELNLHRLWAEIFATAPENVNLFEKMNFIKEGELREKLWRGNYWHNSFIYSILSEAKNT